MMRLFTSPRRVAARIQPRCTGTSAIGAISPGTTRSTPAAASTRGGRTRPRHRLASASRTSAPPTVRPKWRSSARDAACMRRLEERVDEGRQRRALREDDQRAEEGEHDDDRPEPPLLAHAHEVPELAQEGYGGGSWHVRLPVCVKPEGGDCQPASDLSLARLEDRERLRGRALAIA